MMVRDLIIDMKEHDLSLVDKSNVTVPIFNSVWGNLFDEDEENDVLICNIIIPEAYWSMVNYENGEFACQFTAAYMPDTRNFRIRLIALKDGQYNLFGNIRGDFGISVNSYALSKNIAAPISASMLPYVDIDGQFLVKLVQSEKSESLDKAYIYSSKCTDLFINFSDDQSAQLLSLCGPGKDYRYPTTGVNITKYINSVISHSDLDKILETQFDADNRPIQSADFDNTTGQLDVIFRPEKEISDSDLESLDNLNVDFFDQFTDDFVRRSTVINEAKDNDFIKLLDDYPGILDLFLFEDESTTINRIIDQVQEGRFNGFGEIIPSEEYYIVSATLEPNTVIMFDDETEDLVDDSPIFIINDIDETRLYTSLVEQPYWITETCHKCFILYKRSTLRYMIRKSQFVKGKGLFVVPMTSANMKNMLGLVQDGSTGRINGVVSDNTNLSDIILDEVTQHIYASQN